MLPNLRWEVQVASMGWEALAELACPPFAEHSLYVSANFGLPQSCESGSASVWEAQRFRFLVGELDWTPCSRLVYHLVTPFPASERCFAFIRSSAQKRKTAFLRRLFFLRH